MAGRSSLWHNRADRRLCSGYRPCQDGANGAERFDSRRKGDFRAPCLPRRAAPYASRQSNPRESLHSMAGKVRGEHGLLRQPIILTKDFDRRLELRGPPDTIVYRWLRAVNESAHAAAKGGEVRLAGTDACVYTTMRIPRKRSTIVIARWESARIRRNIPLD